VRLTVVPFKRHFAEVHSGSSRSLMITLSDLHFFAVLSGSRFLAACAPRIVDIVQATALPVSADFESGYVDACDALARNVRLRADAGLASLSVEVPQATMPCATRRSRGTTSSTPPSA